MKSLNIDYFSRIDHLRFFAAMLVLFHHFREKITVADTFPNFAVGSFIKFWLVNGSTGVSLFLFLTGFLFCIISDLGSKKIRYSGFVYNRILRIFPLLIFIMFIVISINRANSSPMDIFRILTLQLNTGHSYTGFGHDIFPTGPIWTIAVEFQFYLLFPFLALFLSKYGLRYLVILALFMIMVRYNVALVAHKPMYSNFYHSLLGRLDQFVIGMIFAVGYKRGLFSYLSSRLFSFITIISSLLILMWIFTFKKSFSYQYWSFSVETICWGMIAVSYIVVKLPINTLLDKILSRLGEISFSIYILHLPISGMLVQVLGLKWSDKLSIVLSHASIKAIIVIMISFLTFYLIEKPFMSLRVKYTEDNK